MNGRNHLAAGISVSGLLAATSLLSAMDGAPGALAMAGGAASRAWDWLAYGTGIATPEGAALAGICSVFYLSGVLMPDIDSENSMASKMLGFSLPVAHRGITHSVWTASAFLLAGMSLWHPLAAFGLGVLMHALSDWPSQAGWVPFYPFGSYKKIHGTVFARRHRFVLYSSSSPGSETVAVGLLVLACVLAAAFEAYLVLWPS